MQHQILMKRRLPFTPRPRYNLESIQLRVFGKELSHQAHQAEADVISLLEIALSKSVDFAIELDKSAIPFRQITKRW